MFRTREELTKLQEIAKYRVDGGNGITTFNCATFYRWATGIEASIIPTCESGNLRDIIRAINENRKHYTVIDEPVDGCIVALHRLKHPHHVGFWAYGGVWHCQEEVGIVYSSLRALEENGYEYEFGVLNG